MGWESRTLCWLLFLKHILQKPTGGEGGPVPFLFSLPGHPHVPLGVVPHLHLPVALEKQVAETVDGPPYIPYHIITTL